MQAVDLRPLDEPLAQFSFSLSLSLSLSLCLSKLGLHAVYCRLPHHDFALQRACSCQMQEALLLRCVPMPRFTGCWRVKQHVAHVQLGVHHILVCSNSPHGSLKVAEGPPRGPPSNTACPMFRISGWAGTVALESIASAVVLAGACVRQGARGVLEARCLRTADSKSSLCMFHSPSCVQSSRAWRQLRCDVLQSEFIESLARRVEAVGRHCWALCCLSIEHMEKQRSYTEYRRESGRQLQDSYFEDNCWMASLRRTPLQQALNSKALRNMDVPGCCMSCPDSRLSSKSQSFQSA